MEALERRIEMLRAELRRAAASGDRVRARAMRSELRAAEHAWDEALADLEEQSPPAGDQRAGALAAGSLLPVREQVHQALTLLGAPAAQRLIVAVHDAFFGSPLASARLTSLRRDEERSFRAAPYSRPYYLCAALTADLVARARGRLAVSAWPAEGRVIGPVSPCVNYLQAAIRVAEGLLRVPQPGPAAVRLLRQFAANIPGASQGARPRTPQVVAAAAHAELEVHQDEDLATPGGRRACPGPARRCRAVVRFPDASDPARRNRRLTTAALPEGGAVTSTEARLDQIRGAVAPRNHNARTIAALTSNPGCARRAVMDAAGVDKQRLASHAGFPAPFGQSQFAITRGNAFEAQVKANGCAELLRLLREQLALPIPEVSYDDLEEVGGNTSAELRHARTRRLLARAAAWGAEAGTLFDQPLLRLKVAGRQVYLEPDLIAFQLYGQFRVVEMKSFAVIDGQADGEKVAAAAIQSAVYVLALRELLAGLGYGPEKVSHDAVLVCPENFSNAPVATLLDVRKQLTVLRRQLSRLEHASTGWETLLEGTLKTGWAVTATWPMRTERGGRTRDINSNALASSIVLACRPRPPDAKVTDRRGLIAALREELPGALRKLQQGSVAPVDLPQAAIGPGMAVFSHYARVNEPDGSAMRVRPALALINQVLDEVLSQQEGDFGADTRWCLEWVKSYGVEPGPDGMAGTTSRGEEHSVARRGN